MQPVERLRARRHLLRRLELCTDDSCNTSTGCVHVANTGTCDDGNACTTNDTCAAGSCQGGGTISCNDGNVCTADSCDPSIGCVNAPNGACTDHPKKRKYWRQVCKNLVPGETISQVDLDCISETCTFAGVTTAKQLCNRLYPNPEDDTGEKAEAQFMSLALNLCRQRVTASNAINSSCGSNTTVAQSYAQADTLLCNPNRKTSDENKAKCLSREINKGTALVVP